MPQGMPGLETASKHLVRKARDQARIVDTYSRSGQAGQQSLVALVLSSKDAGAGASNLANSSPPLSRATCSRTSIGCRCVGRSIKQGALGRCSVADTELYDDDPSRPSSVASQGPPRQDRMSPLPLACARSQLPPPDDHGQATGRFKSQPSRASHGWAVPAARCELGMTKSHTLALTTSADRNISQEADTYQYEPNPTSTTALQNTATHDRPVVRTQPSSLLPTAYTFANQDAVVHRRRAAWCELLLRPTHHPRPPCIGSSVHRQHWLAADDVPSQCREG